MKIAIPLFAALLALPLLSALADDEPTFIYGSELMSARERERFRQELQKRNDDAARTEYRDQHRQRIRKRAHQRGVELDEQRGVIRRDEAGERK